MTSAVGSVVIAAAQSVAKVYVIGGIGFAAVKYPKKAPLLPAGAVSTIARFGFNVLTISLIFSTIASSVTIDSIGDYWFILVGAMGVIGISFVTASVLGRILPIQNPSDFNALRIAATFPNIVALPILIFPSLCEYEVVYEAFGGVGEDRAELYEQCTAKSTTMIFCYFFGWSLLFWCCGHPALLNAARRKSQSSVKEQSSSDNSTLGTSSRLFSNSGDMASRDLTEQHGSDQNESANGNNGSTPSSPDDDGAEEGNNMISTITQAVRQVFTSPPFVAMVVAFIVGCIGPLRNLFFSPGGALRFIGAAAESLGQASSPMSTMVVAASLASRRQQEEEAAEAENGEVLDDDNRWEETDDPEATRLDDATGLEEHRTRSPPHESPVMSDPNFGPLHLRRRSSLYRMGTSIRRSSIRAIEKAKRTPPEQRRLLLWFGISKLILSPALVILAIVGLDCSGVLASSGVPDLAKLVLIVNSSVPGALIVVVILKSNPELHETAAVVAKVYFPTYLLSILTIAAWTAVGLIVSIPDDEGNSFCSRF